MTVCQRCSTFHNGHRWSFDQKELELLKKKKVSLKPGLCPGCERIEKRRVDGVVILKGEFLKNHREEAVNLIKNIAEKRRLKNIAARIFDLVEAEDGITVETTDRHLAESIGKGFERAFHGKLDIQWPKKEEFVRVVWKRDA